MDRLEPTGSRPPFKQILLLGSLFAALGVGTETDSRVFHVLGTTMTLMTDAAQTGGKSATISAVVPPGGGPPPHIHTREDETYVILRGHFRFWHGTRVVNASPGSVVYMPRNEIHYFRNVGTTPGAAVLTLVPAGLERMFATMSERKLSAPKDLEELKRLGKDYGITYAAPPTPGQK